MKHIMIEQIELGTYNFLWWKRSNPDRLDICSVCYPKWMSYKQYAFMRFIFALTVIPHFIYALLFYRQIGTFKVNKPHHWEEGQDVDVELENDKIIGVRAKSTQADSAESVS